MLLRYKLISALMDNMDQAAIDRYLEVFPHNAKFFVNGKCFINNPKLSVKEISDKIHGYFSEDMVRYMRKEMVYWVFGSLSMYTLQSLLVGNTKFTDLSRYELQALEENPWAKKFIEEFTDNSQQIQEVAPMIYQTKFMRIGGFLNAMPQNVFERIMLESFSNSTRERFQLHFYNGKCPFFDPIVSASAMSCKLGVHQTYMYTMRSRILCALLGDTTHIHYLDEVLQGKRFYDNTTWLKERLDKHHWAVAYLKSFNKPKDTTIFPEEAGEAKTPVKEVEATQVKVEQTQTWIEAAPVVVQNTKVIEMHKAVGICSICLGDVHIKDDLYVCDLCRTTKPIETAKPIIEMGEPSNFMETRFSMRN